MHLSRFISAGLGLLLIVLTPFAYQAQEAETEADDNSFQLGHQAFLADDFVTAAKIWKPLAEAGDPRAQFAIASLYNDGQGVAENPITAAYWYERAARQGHAIAQYNLGNAYKFGIGVDADPDAARRWWQRSAEAGFNQAQFNLGMQLLIGDGQEPDPISGVDWIRKAAEGGHAAAAEFLETGEIPQRNDSNPAAQSPSVEAQTADSVAMGRAEEAASQPVIEQTEQSKPEESSATNRNEPEAESSAVQSVAESSARNWQDIPFDEWGTTELENSSSGSENVAAVTDLTVAGIHGPEWIIRQPASNYTIQIAAVEGHDGIARFAERYALDLPIAWYPRHALGGNTYAIIAGSFSQQQAATRASDALPQGLKNNQPWVRAMSAIKSQLDQP